MIMKKILYILFLMIPSVLSAADARIERWNSRIEKIVKYRDEAAKIPACDPSLVKLFNDELKSAEEFLAILDQYRTGNGSVKSENKKFTVEEIEALTSEIANPVITIRYAVEIIRSCANQEIKSAVMDGINSYASLNGLPLLQKNRSSDVLTERYILQKYLSGYEKSKQQAYKEILGITEYELSRTGYNSNSINLCRVILKAAEKVTESPLNRETVFNKAYIISLPEWQALEHDADYRNLEINTAAEFAVKHGRIIADDDRAKGIPHIEKIIFQPVRQSLVEMCSNTEKSPSAGYNNPVYEIPDFKRIITAIDDIDRYRKAVSESVPAGDLNNYISRVKRNNTGIAERYLKQYENLFKREKLRIAGLKSKSSSTIVYNEEIFNASERHFNAIAEKLQAYAELSGDYSESIVAIHKSDPALFLKQYSDETEKKLEHVSFLERLTADASEAGKTADTGLNNLYRGSVKELFTMMKKLYATGGIPPEIRNTMTREDIKKHALINSNLRIKGTALTSSARKNFEAFAALYSETVKDQKNEEIRSEIIIGQDEVDRLMNCANRYSEAVASLSYTETALKNYCDKYNLITEDVRESRDLSRYLEKINSGSMIPLVNDFSQDKIDSEMKLRDMLLREGTESLSGAITLMQYYNRRGYTLKYIYTAEDIKVIKEKFSHTPEIAVASWKMNGKNYRLVDLNCTGNLQKMINRKAWHSGTANETGELKEKFSPDGRINFSLSLPDGWKRTVRDDDRGASLSIIFQSPDLLGKIILRAVKYDTESIQSYSDELNKSTNFIPVAKEWGKLNGTDYLMTVSKNRYNSIMESYIIRKEGYVIQITGIADKKKHAVMNKSLKHVFSTLEI